jgi:hypothetical protein
MPDPLDTGKGRIAPMAGKGFRDSKWYKFLSDASLFDWLIRLFFSWLVTWRGTKVMPAELTNPQAWSLTLTVFFGMLVVTSAISKGVSWAIPAYKRRASPHSIVIIPHAGNTATIEIKHYGEPAIWEARGRIRRMLTKAPNPSPTLVLYAIRKDGSVYSAIQLQSDQSANVILARFRYGGGGSQLEVNGVVVPNEGVIVEVEITADPPLRTGIERRCYKIVRTMGLRRFGDVMQTGNPDVIEIDEVLCD